MTSFLHHMPTGRLSPVLSGKNCGHVDLHKFYQHRDKYIENEYQKQL